MIGLFQRTRWLLGTGLSMLGWPLQVLALLLAPLVVVQPALAAGLLVLLFFGERMLGEHAGRYEHLATLAIVLGVVGAARVRAPAQRESSRQGADDHARAPRARAREPAAVSAARAGHSFAGVTMVCAGLAYGWSGDRDEARLRRPVHAPSAAGRAVGPVDRRRVGGVACSAR